MNKHGHLYSYHFLRQCVHNWQVLVQSIKNRMIKHKTQMQVVFKYFCSTSCSKKPRLCHCFFMSSKKVYSSNFKHVLGIWWRYLIVKISDAPCTGDHVSLFVKKTGSCLTVAKCFDNVNFSGKKFKFAVLTKFYPYIHCVPPLIVNWNGVSSVWIKY